jgi:hypothetical protein
MNEEGESLWDLGIEDACLDIGLGLLELLNELVCEDLLLFISKFLLICLDS